MKIFKNKLDVIKYTFNKRDYRIYTLKNGIFDGRKRSIATVAKEFKTTTIHVKNVLDVIDDFNYKNFVTNKCVFSIKSFYKRLKSNFKNVNFIFDEKENRIASKYDIHCRSSDFYYQVFIESMFANTIQIMFNFGEIVFNSESLFLVNKLNSYFPPYMKAHIYKSKYSQSYFIVEFEKHVENDNDAECVFLHEMSYINSDEITAKIKPIYRLTHNYNPSIKEMN